MGVYLGPNSQYAKHEGMYVKPMGKKGVDKFKEALGILYLIKRDLRRGWTYDQSGRKIRMTWKLAERRLDFLLLIAKKSGMPKKYYEKLREIVHTWIETGKPPKIIDRGKKYVVKIRKRSKSKSKTTRSRSGRKRRTSRSHKKKGSKRKTHRHKKRR